MHRATRCIYWLMLLGTVVVTSGLMTGSRADDKKKEDGKEPPPIAEVMEEVQEINKLMIKYNRLSKAAFEAPGKTDEIAKTSEKLAEITKHIKAHAPKKDETDKPIKLWLDTVEGVRKGAQDMAKAAKAKKQAEFKAALKKTDAACTQCHEKFRDE